MSIKGTNRASTMEESYTNTNFWGIDGFKNTVKRLEDGATLCDEFMKMLLERAEIEMKYTLKLREWAKRWNEKIGGKVSEYGSTMEVFKATLREAEEIAEMHDERHNRLKGELCESIKQWKGMHYHKSVLKWKEVKDCEHCFNKIYDPWSRRYNKMDKSKKNFHRAAKASENASLLVSNAEKDNSPPEKLKKLQDQSSKLKSDLQETRKKYEKRLFEMNTSNESYANELEGEFTKWDRFEKIRLNFIKETMLRYHKVLDISENDRLNNIYKVFLSKIQGSDAVKDLTWWSTQYGPLMPQKWPEFEDYDPDKSSNYKSQTLTTMDGGVRHSTDNISRDEPNVVVSTNPFDNDDDDDDDFEDNVPENNMNNQSEVDGIEKEVNDGNEYQSNEDSDGVPVQAKYDYVASEEDELSFYAGDIITQLSGEDEQGWCKGRLNGKVGLFPAKWVDPV